MQDWLEKILSLIVFFKIFKIFLFASLLMRIVCVVGRLERPALAGNDGREPHNIILLMGRRKKNYSLANNTIIALPYKEKNKYSYQM